MTGTTIPVDTTKNAPILNIMSFDKSDRYGNFIIKAFITPSNVVCKRYITYEAADTSNTNLPQALVLTLSSKLHETINMKAIPRYGVTTANPSIPKYGKASIKQKAMLTKRIGILLNHKK